MTNGYVHSIENGVMVDGPGIRTVIFFSGCPLRCQYCHNPDTWIMKNGKKTTISQVLEQINKTSNFIKNSKGGITISGGEPLMQPKFLLEILKECKKLNIHTAIDTSGYLIKNLNKEIIKNTDLFLVDLKSYNSKTYKKITNIELKPTLEFLNILHKNQKPVHIRFVLVPNLTDNLLDIENMAKFLKTMTNIELVEILPFHKMGEFKWKELKLDYKLYKKQPPTKDLIKKVKEIFEKQEMKVKV